MFRMVIVFINNPPQKMTKFVKRKTINGKSKDSEVLILKISRIAFFAVFACLCFVPEFNENYSHFFALVLFPTGLVQVAKDW